MSDHGHEKQERRQHHPKPNASITLSPVGCGLMSETEERVTAPPESYREGSVITTGPAPGLPEIQGDAHLDLIFQVVQERHNAAYNRK